MDRPYAYRCFYGGRRYIKADQRKKGRTKPPGTVLRSNLPYSGRRAYPFYQHLPQTSPAPVARDHIKKYFLQRHTTGGWAPWFLPPRSKNRRNSLWFWGSTGRKSYCAVSLSERANQSLLELCCAYHTIKPPRRSRYASQDALRAGNRPSSQHWRDADRRPGSALAERKGAMAAQFYTFSLFAQNLCFKSVKANAAKTVSISAPPVLFWWGVAPADRFSFYRSGPFAAGICLMEPLPNGANTLLFRHIAYPIFFNAFFTIRIRTEKTYLLKAFYTIEITSFYTSYHSGVWQ